VDTKPLAIMAAFSTQSLRTRLDGLSMSQESIETLSLWLMHHRTHAKQVIQTFKSSISSPVICKEI